MAGVAQWIENRPVNQMVTGLVPSQGTCLGLRPRPQWGGVREATTHLCFSPSLSLSSLLRLKINKIFFKK